MDTPKGICFDCGLKYLTEKQKKEPDTVTAWNGWCIECKKNKPVTSTRNFNYLNKP